ncbi:MAG: DUF5916 domain-containing protein, partial [Candidatus Latescibacteria bacterium]|nr:DUF5916 domain-containing protein [Candidatus Latescibacterota bacterium]
WHISARIHKPWVLAEESGFNLNGWQHWNYDGEILRRGLNFNMWHDLPNNWWWNLGINHEFRAMDDLLTRGGPLVERPSGFRVFYGGGSDRRKVVQVSMFGNAERFDAGGKFEHSTSLNFRIRPVPNVTIDFRPRYRSTKNEAQWIKNLDSNDDGDNDQFVFGGLKSQVWDVTTRLNLSFTPTMSAQFFLQQFVTAGNYRTLKELARPRSYDFDPFMGTLDEDPDFSRRSLKSNMVFRWEY